MAQRKAFNFYVSYWEQIKLLNDKQKLEIFTAICSVQFLEVSINDVEFKDKWCAIVWTGIKHSVDSSLSGFITKSKSIDNDVIEPLPKGGTKDPTEQEEDKEEVKEKEKNKNNTYAEFVSMTEVEYQKLISEHGIKNTKLFITLLDNYKGASGKKYKSDYRAILNWVINRTKTDKTYKSEIIPLSI